MPAMELPTISSAAAAWIDARYRVRATPATIEARAQALAIEQSVEAPLAAIADARVLREVVAQVADVVEREPGLFDVGLRIAVETTGLEAGQLLNMLFGNSSLHDDVSLIDADFPEAFAAHFAGPRFGTAGLRAATHAFDRPLTCAALKPQGLSPAGLAAIAGTLARAGVDVIKDDHGLANQSAAPFAERVVCVQRALDEVNAELDGHCIYAPSLTGHFGEIIAQSRCARDAGARALLIAPMISGVPAFAALVREAGVPIITHPALAGVARIAAPLLLGKLFRLFGADATIFPNAGGRFSYSPETCAAVAAAAREPWHAFARTLPVPAGGMSVERVPDMRAFYGDDAMFLIGGSLLLAREDLLERAREFVAATSAQGDPT